MTALQNTASDPAHSVWVAASAGTGKTTVLTGRVLRLLLDGVRPSKILCITFTKAAAAEMANRIHARLKDWVMLPDTALAETLEKLTGKHSAKAQLHKARSLFAEVLDSPEGGVRIQTIHAFCQSLLARFPLEAGIAPHFQIIEERTARELLYEAQQRLLSGDPVLRADGTMAVGHGEALRRLATRKHEQTLAKLLESLTAERQKLWALFSSRIGGPEYLAEAVYAKLDLAPGLTDAQLVEQAVSAPADGLKEAAIALLNASEAEQERGQCIADWLAVDMPRRKAMFEEYAQVFLTKEHTPRKTVANKPTVTKHPHVAEIIQAEQRRLEAVFAQRRSLSIARDTLDLLAVGDALLVLYDRLKKGRGVLDYGDLILASRDLLKRAGAAAWVLYKLDGGIDHLLVDEAQDTSPEQWEVIAALAEEFFAGSGARARDEGTNDSRTLFVVGDEKQSIYSFQGAEPRAFDRMRRHFAERVLAAEKSWQHVPLGLSFRSTSAVLNVVDAVFAQPEARWGLDMSKEGMDIRHEAHRAGHGGRVELWPLVTVEKEKEGVQPWELPLVRKTSSTPEVQLAERMADSMRRWLDEGESLEARGRPVQPGDIMVLVRHRTRFVDALMRALKKRGIPVAGLDRMVITDHIAILDLMALGDFLLLPQDDLTLAALLKSPLVGLSEDALFMLAHGRDASLWEALKERSNEALFMDVYALLSELLGKADGITPYELYMQVLGARGGHRKLAARLGAEVDDPLNEFLSLAIAYEQSHSPSLQGFLHWLRTDNTVIKRDMEQGRGEVRIMTVHGAKGLQAPIVFLADTVDMPRREKHLFWLEEDGLMLYSPGSGSDNPLCAELREHYFQEQRAEYNRLLYVAMTRAEDRLYVCGFTRNKNINTQSWYALIQSAITPLATPMEDNRLRYSEPQQVPPEVKALLPLRGRVGWGDDALPLPGSFSVSPPEESAVRVLSPSRLGEEEGGESPLVASHAPHARERGILIHRLLQTLPDIAPAAREDAGRRYLRVAAQEFSEQERHMMLAQVIALMEHPDCAALFGANSQAEAALVGVVDGQPVAGQVDRLVVGEQEVIVADYKTRRTIPGSQEEIPAAYRRQMAAYAALLRQIYPDKAVRVVLIWTEGPRFMEIEDKLVKNKAA